MSFQQLRQSAIGYLEFVPPEGAPDGSINLTIYTSGTTQLAGVTWPVTLTASPSTTLSAITEAGGDVHAVADTTNFRRGRTYQLIDAHGSRHAVQVDGVDAGDSTLRLGQTFNDDLPIGTPITAIRYVYQLGAGLTATAGRGLRADWSYMVDGEHVIRTTRFDIVAEPFVLNPTHLEIAGQDPKSGGRLGSIDEQRGLALGAMQRIQADLEVHNMHADLIRNRNVLSLAGVFAMLAAFYGSDTQSLKVSERFNKNYRHYLGAAIKGNPQYDSDDDQVVTTDFSVTDYIL